MKIYLVWMILLCFIFLQMPDTVITGWLEKGPKKDECVKLLKLSDRLNDPYLDRLQDLIRKCRDKNVTYDNLLITEFHKFSKPEYALSLLVYKGRSEYCSNVHSAKKLYRYDSLEESYSDPEKVDFQRFGDICVQNKMEGWEHFVLAYITKSLASVYKNFIAVRDF